MQPVYGDNASRNTVNLNLSECLISSNSLTVIREGSTGELVIAKEVCVLNIRLQLNLSKKKNWLRFVFTAHSFGVDDIGWNTYGQSEANRRFRFER